MIAEPEMQELSNFWTEKSDALSFYFQPPAPTELAHREEALLAKNKLQEMLRNTETNYPGLHSLIERIQTRVDEMKRNSRRAKVIFASKSGDLWKEYDMSGDFGVQVSVGKSFCMAPLIEQKQKQRRYCIALTDRNRARLLLLEGEEITEHTQVLDEEKEKIRTTGTAKSVHLERKKEEQARQHFVFLAEHLLHFHEHGDFDFLLIGCREDMWPEIESELHTDLKKILIGRFTVDPGLATRDEVKEKADAFIANRAREEEESIVAKVIGGAASDGLGATGLSAVARAIEKGEVRTLVVASNNPLLAKNAAICTSCGHIQLNAAAACSLCSSETRCYDNAKEALLRAALERGVEIQLLRKTSVDLPDGIAALLRFRSDHNTPQALAS